MGRKKKKYHWLLKHPKTEFAPPHIITLAEDRYHGVIYTLKRDDLQQYVLYIHDSGRLAAIRVDDEYIPPEEYKTRAEHFCRRIPT